MLQADFNRGFYKRAQEYGGSSMSQGDVDKMLMIPAGLSMAALIPTILATHMAGKKMKKSLKSMPELKPAQVSSLLKEMDVHLPVRQEKKLDNAYYAKHDPATGKESVVYGEGFGKMPVIAHEGGHAKIQHGQAGKMHKLMQNMRFAPFAGALGAYGLNRMMPSLTENMHMTPTEMGVMGGAAGLGLYGLTQIPVLINERKATNIAKEFMAKKKLDKSGKGSQALDNAYKTYRNSAIGSTVGGIAALGSGAYILKHLQEHGVKMS